MLSILIPTYNYNSFPLVQELHRQCLDCGIEFEIISLDDASTEPQEDNLKINVLINSRFEVLEKNKGRTQTRQILAKKAKYNWLLFLDTDVIPEESSFIQNYISQIKPSTQIIFGGYKYSEEKPSSSNILRYHYGKNREEKPAFIRNKDPYKFIFSGNMLIKKDLFLEINFAEEVKFYGMDIYFSFRLWQKEIPIIHINNSIIHLGLDKNISFLEKSLQSIVSRKLFLENEIGIEHINPLLAKHKLLKKFHLTGILKIGFYLLEPILKKMILSKNPSLLCFDLYRLGYICTLK